MPTCGAPKHAVKAERLGADAIVVSCGLCQINLDMRQGGQDFPILYITEVLGEAMQRLKSYVETGDPDAA